MDGFCVGQVVYEVLYVVQKYQYKGYKYGVEDDVVWQIDGYYVFGFDDGDIVLYQLVYIVEECD